jgi:hypothetical protein
MLGSAAWNLHTTPAFHSRKEDVMVEQPGLDNRHRDKNGQIARKHGHSLVSTLRKIYGAHFATDCPGDAKLVDVLHRLDEPSLTRLVHDVHGQG